LVKKDTLVLNDMMQNGVEIWRSSAQVIVVCAVLWGVVRKLNTIKHLYSHG